MAVSLLNKIFNSARSTLLKGSRLLSACSLAILTSCTDGLLEDSNTVEYDKECITLNFSLSPDTRAINTGDLENSYNENKIHGVDVFFYSEDESKIFTYNYHPSGNNTFTSVKIPLKSVRDVLGIGNCKIIAVANCSETSALINPTLADLNKIVTKAYKTNSEGSAVTSCSFRSASAPTDFVMTNLDAGNIITIPADDDNDVSVTVKFKRVAAKIRVALDVVDAVYQKGSVYVVPDSEEEANSLKDQVYNKWVPRKDQIRIYISNGVRAARLDGAITTEEGTSVFESENDYYQILTSGSTETEDYELARLLKTEDRQLYYNELPYYSYPNEWTDSPAETHNTRLTVVVPWEDEEGNVDTYRPSYYYIPVNDQNKIESNKFYYIRTHIAMIGSETSELPMEIPMECEIAEWGTAKSTEVDIRPVRYLIFDHKSYVMNNETHIEIPFITTHKATITKKEVTCYKYTENYGQKKTINITDGWTANIEDNILKFSHTLYDDPQYSKYDVNLTVRHDDQKDLPNTEFEEIITLTIYPAAYVEVDYCGNSPYVYVNTGGTPLGNNYADNHGDTGDIKGVVTVTITQLNEQEKTKWVIDDPRTYYINNELDNSSMLSDLTDHTTVFSNFTTAKTIWSYFPDFNLTIGSSWSSSNDRNNRKLLYYYPCGESYDKGNVVAPKFVIAGIQGAHRNSIDRETVRRRCASYQQLGYPAGRWRLPTQAEVAYIRMLQLKGIINDVFYNGTTDNTSAVRTVWCNLGITRNYGEEITQTTGDSYSRCVYDLWYWERVDSDANGNSVSAVKIPEGNNKANWETFTWGDRPKENPQTRVTDMEANTVESFLQRNAKGNYVLIMTPEGERLEKLEK